MTLSYYYSCNFITHLKVLLTGLILWYRATNLEHSAFITYHAEVVVNVQKSFHQIEIFSIFSQSPVTVAKFLSPYLTMHVADRQVHRQTIWSLNQFIPARKGTHFNM